MIHLFPPEVSLKVVLLSPRLPLTNVSLTRISVSFDLQNGITMLKINKIYRSSGDLSSSIFVSYNSNWFFFLKKTKLTLQTVSHLVCDKNFDFLLWLAYTHTS
jgi:hypothetical protein